LHPLIGRFGSSLAGVPCAVPEEATASDSRTKADTRRFIVSL
jgi:hypothetical protein